MMIFLACHCNWWRWYSTVWIHTEVKKKKILQRLCYLADQTGATGVAQDKGFSSPSSRDHCLYPVAAF